MRVLITGASGFAGGWLARACALAGDEVTGVSRSGAIPQGCGRGVAIDLADGASLADLLSELRPEVVYHLAGLSHVGRSWEDPEAALAVNATGAAALLQAMLRAAPQARLVWASSGEVYGSKGATALDEDAPINPENPYAVSKAAGDLLAGIYAQTRGLQIVRARAFAHAGPGQRDLFLISSLAKQAATARVAGAKRLEIRTGRAETRREVTDVRDVVQAYRLLAESRVPPGVYNVCSGVSSSTAQRVAAIAAVIAPIEVQHVVDPALVRAHEVPDLRGSYERLRRATGWEPRVPFERTLADTIAWWESRLDGGGQRAAAGATGGHTQGATAPGPGSAVEA